MNFPWTEVITKALINWSTPFYLSAWEPIVDSLKELKTIESAIPIRHWLSLKTHPIKPLLKCWLDTNRGVEVVSEFELLAALTEGAAPENILINGVAKHSWLHKYNLRNLKVHFDSIQEISALGRQAKDLEWHIGVRLHVKEEYDPDEPQFSGQFGLSDEELINAVTKLRQIGVLIESIHFHLRSNVFSPSSYRIAIEEVSRRCCDTGITPYYLDCGGGLPSVGISGFGETRTSLSSFVLEFKNALANIPSLMPSIQEIWLENGRFITGNSAVLVVRVTDIKERDNSRYLICDGGRTNHAIVSDWETHHLFTIPHRNGPPILTTVCGPTCMAFDRLTRTMLPANIEIGDYVIWTEAGAYHIPWETRFSHGLAKVLWCDQNMNVTLARNSESFSSWWSTWN